MTRAAAVAPVVRHEGSATTYRPVNRTRERLFFSGMALLLAVVVVIGFGHSYFGAGMLRAPLPNLLVHVHAAVFTSWMILFLVQTGLVSAKRVGWHRTLGVIAYCLPPIMVPLGTITGLDELRRERVFDAASSSRRFRATRRSSSRSRSWGLRCSRWWCLLRGERGGSPLLTSGWCSMPRSGSGVER